MAKSANPFRYFRSSPDIIRMVMMLYVRYPRSLRNVEDLLFERGCNLCHETVRLWWWHLDEMYVKLNGEMVYLWRAVDLESYVTKNGTFAVHEEGFEA